MYCATSLDWTRSDKAGKLLARVLLDGVQGNRSTGFCTVVSQIMSKDIICEAVTKSFEILCVISVGQ